MQYRPEIDGLRCIAVISVLLFHYGIAPFSGGFVGVDVFFVISGYLITSLILSEAERNDFSLLRFYDRRVRRIVPASITTVLITGFAGYFLLLPKDYAEFGRSAVAAVFGLANLHFYWNTGGYFDTSAEMMPLLHMWSLGVEEQFYLVWPLLLIGTYAASKGSRTSVQIVLATLLVGSFTASIAVTRSNEQLAFYMLHTRAWELALGAMVAFAPPITRRPLGETASAIGLALIALSILVLTSTMPFPGVNALYPCVGAALIVWPKTQQCQTEKHLASPALVFCGKISFSLYLWHWPVLVMYRQLGSDGTASLPEGLALVTLSFILAVATWKFIEQPFRRWRPRSALLSVCFGALSVASVGALAHWLISATGGLPSRLPEEARRIEEYRNRTVSNGDREMCFLTSTTERRGVRFDRESCIVRDGSKPRVLLLGDSHAAHLYEGLRDTFPYVAFSQATASGCRPVIPVKGARRCADLMKDVFERIAPAERFDAIIISSQWPKNSIRYLRATVDLLNGFGKVIVLGPSTEYLSDLPALLAKESMSGGNFVNRNSTYEATVVRNDMVERSLTGAKVEFYSLTDLLCPEADCMTMTPAAVPMMFDQGHFTREGASYVAEKLRGLGLLSSLQKNGLANTSLPGNI